MRAFFRTPDSGEPVPLRILRLGESSRGRAYLQDPFNGSLAPLKGVHLRSLSEKPALLPVFRLESASVSGSQLVDLAGGRKAAAVGRISSSEGGILNEGASWMFSFPLEGPYTLRVRFRNHKIDSVQNCLGFGGSEEKFSGSIHIYAGQNSLFSQSVQTVKITDATVGNSNLGKLQLCSTPFESHEIVVSMGEIQEKRREIRIFCDGQLKQNGRLEHGNYMPPDDFQTIGNREGKGRFMGEYSLIELYDRYMDRYEEAFFG